MIDDHLCLGVRFERIRVQEKTSHAHDGAPCKIPGPRTIIRAASECEFQRPSSVIPDITVGGPRAATSRSRVAVQCARAQLRARWRIQLRLLALMQPSNSLAAVDVKR